jgi:hypothetical protein
MTANMEWLPPQRGHSFACLVIAKYFFYLESPLMHSTVCPLFSGGQPVILANPGGPPILNTPPKTCQLAKAIPLLS